jgi:DNA-binding NtrC family response regulator
MPNTQHVASRPPGVAVAGALAAETLVGVSDWVKALRAEIRLIASCPSSVLISGPSGTGKELIAQAIHFHSPRAAKPFIAVDCAAINGTLFTSHVFGYDKGAFTGADCATIGCFRAAHGGTIFLDEIGELELEFQAKLLRVLQQRTVTPVGGHAGVAVDVRVLAATNGDLKAMVEAGRFREDLYYRLNVIRLKTVPLKDRPEDISVLAEHILARLALRNASPVKLLSPHWLECMRAHDWPGNVRELENFLERIVLVDEHEIHPETAQCLCAGRAICQGDSAGTSYPGKFFDCSRGRDGACPWQRVVTSGDPVRQPSWPTLAELERQHIARTLEHALDNQTLAARLLGISRQHLCRKIKTLGLDSSRFRPGRPRK